MILDGKRVLVTGGTGSLGGKVVRALLRGDVGRPAGITVFSRDEAKQNDMRLSFLNRPAATDEVIYANSQQILNFRIGDVRDYAAIRAAIEHADVVINAAALKQVPSCEYFPVEAVQTNVIGAANLVRAIRESGARVETVVGISTDKACKPVNVMGMTKALMERIFAEANLEVPSTRFVCVRYGNVIASRGSGRGFQPAAVMVAYPSQNVSGWRPISPQPATKITDHRATGSAARFPASK